jgi:kinesin family protein 6/9
LDDRGGTAAMASSGPPATAAGLAVAAPATASASSRVSVACRLRPTIGRGSDPAAWKKDISLDDKEKVLSVRNPKHGTAGVVDNSVEAYRFQVNNVLTPDATQEEVFNQCVKDLADSVLLNGISCTLMAYGATGSGKTHSMIGPPGNFQQRGVVPRAIEYICKRADAIRSEAVMAGGTSDESDRQLTLRCSYLEIYNDHLIDLLAANPDFGAVAAAAAGEDADGDDAAGAGTGRPAGAGGGISALRAGTKPRNTFGSVTTDALREKGSATAALAVAEDKKGRVHVKGLSAPVIASEAEAFNLLFAGEANRAIAEHALNKASTRSHCIFTLYVEQRMPAEGPAAASAARSGSRVGAASAASRQVSAAGGVSRGGSLSRASSEGGAASDAADGSDADAVPTPPPLVTVISKLHLVDLAGSERVFKSESEGALQREAAHINRSLTFLEQVVIALLDKSRDHVPFRSCKLTHILKEAFYRGKTRLLACAWPDPSFLDETVGTLRFATRMMNVKTSLTRDVVNAALSDAERARSVGTSEAESAQLRSELALHDALAGRAGVRYAPLDASELAALQRSVRAFVDGGDDGAADVEALQAPTLRHMHEAMRMLRGMVRAQREQAKAGAGFGGAMAAAAAGVGRSGSEGLVVGSGAGAMPAPLVAVTGTDDASGGRMSSMSASRFGADMRGASAAGSATGGPDAAARPDLPAALQVGRPGSVASDVAGSAGGAAYTPFAAAPSVSDAAGPPLMSPDTLIHDDGARTAELMRWRSPGGSGGRLYTDFLEAKQNLKERKGKYGEGAASVNETKREIDALMVTLAEHGSADASPVSDEAAAAKAAVVQQLSASKATYRSRFEALQEVKAEVDYLQRVSDQLAQRIATEFQRHWVAKCTAEAAERSASAAGSAVSRVGSSAVGFRAGSESRSDAEGSRSIVRSVYEAASIKAASIASPPRVGAAGGAAALGGAGSPGRFAHSSKSAMTAAGYPTSSLFPSIVTPGAGGAAASKASPVPGR